MSGWRKQLKYAFLILLVKSLIWISSWMPEKWLHAVFVSLAGMAYRTQKKFRELTVRNIQIGYPEKTEQESRHMARAVFLNAGRNFADVTKGLSIRTRKEYRKRIHIEGEDHFQRAFEKGKGVIALGCHLGSFEFLGTYCGLHYPPLVGVGARLKNSLLDKLLVDSRTSRGMDYSYRGNNTLKMIRALEKGQTVIMLIDQDIDQVRNVFVDFYGKKTATPVGAALFALKTGASVVPMAMSLQNGRQVLTICPEVEVTNTGKEEHDLVTNTQKFSDALEGMIRKCPDQWVWMHERWKTRPAPGEAGPSHSKHQNDPR